MFYRLNFITLFLTLIVLPLFFRQSFAQNDGPVAVGSAEPMINMEGCAGEPLGYVSFRHDLSYHTQPSLNIIEFQWLFDIIPTNPRFDLVDWNSIPNNGYSNDGLAWRGSSRYIIPIHRYMTSGIYHAALRVIDNSIPPKSNIFIILSIIIQAQPQSPPVVSAQGPYVISIGQDLTIQGTMDDPNFLCDPNESLIARWYLNSDEIADYFNIEGVVPWSTLAILNPPLPMNQQFNIRLVVWDAVGLSSSAYTSLAIYDPHPIADYSFSPPVATCLQDITFDGSTSFHRNPARSIIKYEWDFDNNGPFEVDTIGMVVSHSYPNWGSYNAVLRVTDDLDYTATVMHSIPVNLNLPPIADAGGPYTTTLGLQVSLDGSGSTDPNTPCGDQIVSYLWDINNDGNFGDLTGERPTLVVSGSIFNPGVFQIGLLVMDMQGSLSNISQSTLTVYGFSPIASFYISPPAVTCFESITFDASASFHQHPDHHIVQYEWDFDAPTLNEFQRDTIGIIVVHAYPLLGSYFAWLRVTDDQGIQDTSFKTINSSIGNIPPVANAGGPYMAPLGSNIVLDGQSSTDPNMPCDRIVSYLWDINNDGNFGDLTGPNPTLIISSPIYQIGISYPIQLRVTDLLGFVSNISQTTLHVQEPVPVQLSTFIAKVLGTTVMLIWRTETETNNYGFEIERSIKSEVLFWSKIGFIPGTGNSNSPMDYSFTDKNPLGGCKFLYRLKQIDSDGKFDYSDAVEIEILPAKWDLYQNYPNPFNPTTTIGFGIPASPNPSKGGTFVNLKVYDVLGNEVTTLVNEEKEAGYHSIDFNASDLQSGVYFYQLRAGAYVQTKKMLLLR